MFQKLGVIADIHANSLALEAVLRHAQKRGVRRFVNLGDILYGPLRPLETYRILQRTERIVSIIGNQDRQILEATTNDLATNQTLAFVIDSLGSEPIAWLRNLPANAVIDDTVFLCHGTPTSDTTYLLEDVASGRPEVRTEATIIELLGGVHESVILCGHTHIPRVIQLSNRQLIMNPGSIGVQAYEDHVQVKHRMETNAPHASYATLEKGQSGWDVSLHRVSYDWDKAEKQARDLNREDWAQGIATGRMD